MQKIALNFSGKSAVNQRLYDFFRYNNLKSLSRLTDCLLQQRPFFPRQIEGNYRASIAIWGERGSRYALKFRQSCKNRFPEAVVRGGWLWKPARTRLICIVMGKFESARTLAYARITKPFSRKFRAEKCGCSEHRECRSAF